MSRFAPPLRLMARYPVGGLIALLSGSGCHDAQIDWPQHDSSHGVVVMLPGEQYETESGVDRAPRRLPSFARPTGAAS